MLVNSGTIPDKSRKGYDTALGTLPYKFTTSPVNSSTVIVKLLEDIDLTYSKLLDLSSSLKPWQK